jgi:hypothetical protein
VIHLATQPHYRSYGSQSNDCRGGDLTGYNTSLKTSIFSYSLHLFVCLRLVRFSLAMSVPGDIQSTFDEAVKEFKRDLGDEELYKELLKTTTIDQVYDATDKLQKDQLEKGHLRHLSKIQPFLEGLRSYGATIEVFLQVKPEILGLIWGPIKLLLQWTSTLKQSLDDIINTTADIGILLPEFREVIKLFNQNEPMKNILLFFFKDILKFYLIALKFFRLSSKSSLTKLSIYHLLILFKDGSICLNPYGQSTKER